MLVLWGTTLLALIAGSFALAMRSEATLATHQVESARVAALADAGLHIGIYELLEPDEEQIWPRDGRKRELTMDGVNLEVSLEVENGKVDLNAAPEAWIKAVVDSVVDPSTLDAVELTHRILDWRDADNERREQGAEDLQYTRETNTHGARDGPFNTVEDLSQVLGLDPLLLERLRPLVTVYSNSPQVDPRYASRAVLLAVPGIDTAQVETFLTARQASLAAGNDLPNLGTTLTSGRLFLAKRKATTFTVQCIARSPTGATGFARVVIGLTGFKDTPYQVLSWSDTASF